MSLESLPPLAPCGRRSPLAHPYESAISASASSSQSSIFSADALSQSSHSSQSSRSSVTDGISTSWEQHEFKSSVACSAAEPPVTVKRVLPQPIATSCAAPAALELRQNPRRCPLSGNRPPPALVRQSERKGQFVDCLVDSATQMVEVIWPTSVPACRGDSGRGVLPLRTFIQETLRRSRTSFSTLQVALYYLILIKAHVPCYDFTMEQPEDAPAFRALQCGRRMFLAALILASKYLQDRNYSARAWSKISGLKVCEINTNEMAFLSAVDWKLHIAEPLFEKWQEIILRFTPSQQPPSPGAASSDLRWAQWRSIVLRLSPELDGVDVPKPMRLCGPIRKSNTWPTLPASPTSPFTPTPLSAAPSSESTPTPSSVHNLPRYLEPRLDMRPPTPARLGPLPTPNMTPQSAVSTSCVSTPAASVLSAAGSRRPSMCAAMQAAQCSMASRMAESWACSAAAASRRPSLAPSVASTMSMTSSPESMVSDAPSRSSRASSISSASSWTSVGLAQACTVTPVKLARFAALRCAGLPTKPVERVHVQPEIVDVDTDVITIEPMSSPDFDSFHIHDAGTPSSSIPDDMAQLSRMDSGKSYSSASSTTSNESSCSPPRMGAAPTFARDNGANVGPTSCFADLVVRERQQLRQHQYHQPQQRRSGPTQNRKRGRSSIDLSLQQNVRDLLVAETRAARVHGGGGGCAIPTDVQMDDATPTGGVFAAAAVGKTLEVQSPGGVPCVNERLPVRVQRDGRKRACCTSNPANNNNNNNIGGGVVVMGPPPAMTATMTEGVRLWEGVA